MTRIRRRINRIMAVILTVLMVLSFCDTKIHAYVTQGGGSEYEDIVVQKETVSSDTVKEDFMPVSCISENTVSDDDIEDEEYPVPEERFFGYIENDFSVDMPKDGSLNVSDKDEGVQTESGNYKAEHDHAYNINDDSINPEGLTNEIAVPARFTLNDNKYVSSVKDQGAWGTCWSFMAMAAAESAYLRQNPDSEADLSETQLVKYFYNGYYGEDIDRLNGDGTLKDDCVYPGSNVKPVMMGGNGDFTTFALTRWTGAADEGYAPTLKYPSAPQTESLKDVTVAKELAYDADAEHLQNAYWLDIKNRQDIKKAIMQFGTAGMAYYNSEIYGSDYYKKKLNPSYSGPAVYYNNEKNASNHEVAIVGWDDDFDRNNFKYTYNNVINAQKGYGIDLPSSNGAWLIKNSQGTSYGDGGFVWISYEDVSLAKEGRRVYVFDFEPADNYAHNYQYDGSCYTAQKTYPYAAAVYTASGDQQIEAVGIGFASANNEYTVRIYTDLSDPSNPESGNMVSEKSGNTTYPGFYTIVLDEFANINNGSKFSVVVRSRTGNNGFTSFFVDSSFNYGTGYRFVSNLTNDKTFFRNENTQWLSSPSRDLATIRLKAYSNDRAPGKKSLGNFSVDLPQLRYNGADRTEELSEALVIMDDGKVLRDTHYTFEFDRTPCEAGKYKLTVTGKNDYEGTKVFDFAIDKAPFTQEDVSLEYTETFYNASPLKPAVYINAGKGISSSANYEAAYTDNKECGTATVTVTGKNSLYGKATLTFKINKCPVSKTNVVVEQAVYTGKALTPGTTVTLGGYRLVEKTDYIVSYSNNVNASYDAVVTITGCGNFTGTKEQKFTIYAEKIPAISVLGKAGTSQATVKYGNEILSPLYYDLEIFYGKDNLKVDIFEATKTYTVRVKLKGNYSGDIIVPNVQVSAEIGNLMLTLRDSTPVYYTGKALKPAMILIDERGNVVPSKNYKLTYENNIKAGTASVTAVGKGLFKGTASTTFTIHPAVLRPSMIKAVKDQKYTGKAITPKLVIKGLKQGKDYTCTYSNNVNVSYDDGGNVIKGALITIKPSSDYTFEQGFSGNYYFKILPAAINKVSAKNGYYRGEGNQVYPSSLTVKAGKLVPGSGDYTVTYTNNTSILKSATVTVTAKSRGNYTGKKSAKYKLVRENVKKMKVSGLGDRKYTGGRICPDITVVNSYGETLVKGKDYSVSYGKNTKPGYGTVKISAIKKGRYKGSVTKKFKILK